MTKEQNTKNEFIMRRCDEILESDKIYQEYNQKILAAEKEFKALLTPEQRRKYDQIEEIVIASISHINTVIYKAAAEDSRYPFGIPKIINDPL